MQPRILDGVAEAADFREIAVLFFACLGISGEEIGDGVVIEREPGEVAGIDAVLVLRPLGFEADDGVVGEFFRGIEDR